jgi:hypothetical protein
MRAAYFAFIGEGQGQTAQRAVYALASSAVTRRVERLVRDEPEDAAENTVDFIRPHSDDNPRLVNQGGLFTRSPDGIALENWVARSFPGEKTYILMKILIPNKDRKECLTSLNRMNINHLTLFPDVYGASKYCNIDLELDGY